MTGSTARSNASVVSALRPRASTPVALPPAVYASTGASIVLSALATEATGYVTLFAACTCALAALGSASSWN